MQIQPNYWDLEPKINARYENIKIFKKLTGQNQLPQDRQYWTLCNYQPPDKNSEIVQLENLKFLTKNQFHGVDRDTNIIQQNKIWHPQSNWYHGEWIEIIRKQKFNPGLIYLDTVNFADHKTAANLTVTTMFLCPNNTVLLVNAMLNDPRSRRRFNENTLIERIGKDLGHQEIKKWLPKVDCFDYNATTKTDMITYVFYKQE